ncbi:MAG: hypothetical protein ACXWWL_03275, partial [Candidatus Limnocylindria bacterium]
MTARRAAATALAALVSGAACTAAPARSSPTTTPPAAASAPTVASPATEPTTAPRASSRPTIGPLDLDHERLDPAWTGPLLEFASDGASVIFSSGVADGLDGEFAPDLWRYTPRAVGPELLWRNPRRDRSLVRI